MSPDVFIIGCVALLSAFIFSNLCAYKFGKYQGWMEVLRKSTQHEKENITLKKGETLVAVVDMKKRAMGPDCFLLRCSACFLYHWCL